MRSLKRSVVALVSAALVTLALAPAARARPDDLAKAHYNTGLAYYQRGAYADAIREFERAYALSQRPELLYNIGQAHERAGDLAAAVSFFERYLPHAGADSETLEQKVANLKRRLAATGIRVTASADGAEISVDGKRVGTTPVAELIPLPPGQHHVTVSKAGYAPYSLTVSVVAGTAVTIAAELQRTTDRAATPAPRDEPAPAQRERLWTWIVWGTAGALLAGGAVTGGLALGKAGDAQSAADEDAARGMALAADVLLGVGAAAAVVGTVLFFLEGKPREAPRAALLPALSPRYVGATARLRF